TFVSRRELAAAKQAADEHELKARKSKDDAENRITELRLQHEEEIAELAGLCRRLNDQLGKDNREKQAARVEEYTRARSFLKDKMQTKTIAVQVDTILDPATPEEALFHEANEALQNYEKRK
ncbi:MAG: hypothetical protein QUS09_02960, partial [Methanotrichaceae archaeon]|nr:hypothetical protein [Methanotrichaceae archaeon]